METIQEHDSRRRSEIGDLKIRNQKTGVSCPECGSELLDPAGGCCILTSNPPQVRVECSKCDYSTTILY